MRNISRKAAELKMTFGALLGIGVLFFGNQYLQAANQTIYIDSGAKEAGDGSPEKPFAALDAARDFLRSAKKAAPADSFEVILADGRYEMPSGFSLSADDSGTKEAPILYRAQNAGKAVLSGGKTVPPELFQPLAADDPLRDRIDPEVLTRLATLDLAALEIAPFPEIGPKSALPLPIPELFCGGRRMTIARWPNDGWATIAEIIDGGSKADSGQASDAAKMKKNTEKPRGGTFRYDGGRPSRWKSDGVFLHGYWCFDWSSEVLKVDSIDPEKKTITLGAQHTYGLRQGNPSPRRWMAIHLLEELDAPGEYYVDQKSNRLYFYPPCDLKSARVVLAFNKTPVVSAKEVSFVTFRGLVVEESYSSGMEIVGGESVRVERGTVRNARHLGVDVRGGKNHAVCGCLIEETGCGGVTLSGGDRRTLTRANHVVEDCVIRGFSRHRLCYANGINLSGVGLTARHNELYDAPHQAVSLSANDSLFEFNEIHDVCLTGDDCGALYKGRNPSMRGNMVRYNYWHDIGSPRGHGNAAVYFDDGDGGEVVFGNVFVRTGEPGRGSFGSIFCHGGHGNLAENNIFVDCKRPLGSSPWNDQRWKEYIDAPLWQTRLLKEVDITKPPYTERYPELVGFMDGAPIEKRRNIARKNVFVRPELPPTGSWDLDESNWTTDADPGFVDAAKGNYALKSGSEVFRKIPGFEPIPFDKIGPRNESAR